MERVIPLRTDLRLGTAARFVAVGLLIYATLLAGAEWLTYRNGHMNPIFKIETAAPIPYDWVILGASHAMPLDFDGFNAEIETATSMRVLNLAGPGTGPLYNRFVFEHFLRRHRTRNVLYVVDAFAFRSPQWNEERFADPKLLARTPWNWPLLGALALYVWRDGVDPRVLLDYASSFSKLNNRDRFQKDAWEGEVQFDRVFRPSATADRKRVEYLYPPVEDEESAEARYLSKLSELIETARAAGASVTLTRFPVSSRFERLLPREQEFVGALEEFAREHEVMLADFSDALEGRTYYADTDHLNRAGAREFLARHLRPVLTAASGSS